MSEILGGEKLTIEETNNGFLITLPHTGEPGGIDKVVIEKPDDFPSSKLKRMKPLAKLLEFINSHYDDESVKDSHYLEVRFVDDANDDEYDPTTYEYLGKCHGIEGDG